VMAKHQVADHVPKETSHAIIQHEKDAGLARGISYCIFVEPFHANHLHSKEYIQMLEARLKRVESTLREPLALETSHDIENGGEIPDTHRRLHNCILLDNKSS
jgi:hypothetical protein